MEKFVVKSKQEYIKEALHDEETLLRIERTLLRGDRVELVPVKEGVKLLCVKRNELNK
jgi:hypothetical protein